MTVRATFENGVFRPVHPVRPGEVREGEDVDLFILQRDARRFVGEPPASEPGGSLRDADFEAARRRAIALIENAPNLGGATFTRDELHER